MTPEQENKTEHELNESKHPDDFNFWRTYNTYCALLFNIQLAIINLQHGALNGKYCWTYQKQIIWSFITKKKLSPSTSLSSPPPGPPNIQFTITIDETPITRVKKIKKKTNPWNRYCWTTQFHTTCWTNHQEMQISLQQINPLSKPHSKWSSKIT